MYCFYDCSCYVYYICNACLKERPSLKILFNKIYGIDISPRAIADKAVCYDPDFHQKQLEEQIKDCKEEGNNG